MSTATARGSVQGYGEVSTGSTHCVEYLLDDTKSLRSDFGSVANCTKDEDDNLSFVTRAHSL